MPKFLHVGCGQKRKEQTTKGFNSSEWEEIRFDIDENVNPDLIGTILDRKSPDRSGPVVHAANELQKQIQ